MFCAREEEKNDVKDDTSNFSLQEFFLILVYTYLISYYILHGFNICNSNILPFSLLIKKESFTYLILLGQVSISFPNLIWNSSIAVTFESMLWHGFTYDVYVTNKPFGSMSPLQESCELIRHGDTKRERHSTLLIQTHFYSLLTRVNLPSLTLTPIIFT